jgi:hypothetical protein
MQISPETLQPVPPGYVPALGAASGVIVISGAAAAQLQLYQPGSVDPIVVVINWTPNPSTGAYTATLTLDQIDTIAVAGPTLHCQVNGGPTFHVKNSGMGDSLPSTGGSGQNPGPGAGYYTKGETDQLLADVVAPAGGQYRLKGPNGERVIYVKNPDTGDLVPVLGGGDAAHPAIDAGDPVAEDAQPEAS